MKDFTITPPITIEGLLKNFDILPSKDKQLIQKAYEYAVSVHKTHKRISGKTYIEHCIAVADYVRQLQLDTTSVVVALLHDTVERGGVDIDDIDQKFGTEVAFLVSGLTDIKLLSGKHTADEQNIEFKHLIMSATEDIRVIVIRICEKLEGIFTIENFDQQRQERIAQFIMNIYAPLAEYLNLGIVQKLLQDEAFKILLPQKYTEIKAETEKFLIKIENSLELFENKVTTLLQKYNIDDYLFYGRQKGLYSAYKKATRKQHKINELKDFFAYRLIVNSVEQCYVVLGLIHSAFPFLQEEFDDYISVPKENGYQSIHTVIEFENTLIEIQIRTHAMHEHNEYGPASHIAYKLGSTGEDFSWTKDLAITSTANQNYKVNVFQNSIFVFTPKGLVIKLVKHATPLDFAFKIHTNLGHCYRGALVNGKMVSMDYELDTGDIVEIQTTKEPNVRRDWLNNCTSNETKRRIRRFLRQGK